LQRPINSDRVDSYSDADSDDSEEDTLSQSAASEDHEVASAGEIDLHNHETGHLVPALDPADYGKLPSYYSNSQPIATSSSADIDPEITSGIASRLRQPIIPRDQYDGVDSDDETESDEERLNNVGDRVGENSDSEEDRPQVVGEIEIDMIEEEEDFIKFSREALGIDEDMWKSIVRDREARGGIKQHLLDYRR
jgi:hypothetical protein